MILYCVCTCEKNSWMCFDIRVVALLAASRGVGSILFYAVGDDQHSAAAGAEDTKRIYCSYHIDDKRSVREK